MQNTNPSKLRADLKDYLDLAQNEPIRIQRRTGETFVLINEESYASMQLEIMSLQKRLLAMSDILDGSVKDLPGSEELMTKLKAK